MILAIEEMAELTKALTKCIRGESGWWEMLITEMTDVEIMLEQIKEMFVQLPQEIETNKKVKLQRLKDRLGINE